MISYRVYSKALHISTLAMKRPEVTSLSEEISSRSLEIPRTCSCQSLFNLTSDYKSLDLSGEKEIRKSREMSQRNLQRYCLYVVVNTSRNIELLSTVEIV